MRPKWYCARTRPMTEYMARDRLEAAGWEVFLPCVRTVRPRRGREDAPLFPGYLFLRYDLEELSWQALEQVPQVVGLVSFEGVIPAVPEEVIAQLRERVEAINGSGGLWRRFYPGERVRVSLGPMESLAEVVTGAKSPQERVRVLLEFLGQLVYAEVPWKAVEPVGVDEDVEGVKGRKYRTQRRLRRTRGKGRYTKGFGPRAGEGSYDG